MTANDLFSLAFLLACSALFVVACGDGGPCTSTGGGGAGGECHSPPLKGSGTPDGVPVKCATFEDCHATAECREYECTCGECQYYDPSVMGTTCGPGDCNGWTLGGSVPDPCVSSACVASHCDTATHTCVAHLAATAPAYCVN